tara:strand:- start:573 stop:749 length:177 start_codon:yes stop_codon:yes gene_type:complete
MSRISVGSIIREIYTDKNTTGIVLAIKDNPEIEGLKLTRVMRSNGIVYQTSDASIEQI